MTTVSLADRQAARRRLRDEGFASIHQRWPSTTWGYDEWYDALGDTALLLSIYSDILKIGWDVQTRRGERGPLDPILGAARHVTLQAGRAGTASLEPFAVAFNKLRGARSLSHLAYRTGLSRSKTDRLLRGVMAPTPEEMEAVAAAFGKHPTYFLEYRVHLVTAALARQLLERPEMSVHAAARLGVAMS